ncbi:PREDICTED: melanoma-associated antigen B4-like [Hipposideros armiger]|uniref:Melanoma-associated antigen B4-like n=1 Tax=Hipposideros armiger TaxID=186990 RepID=A0A8B7SHP3_HIPAR|nr:PREDICTED: melanoma-associated antigen B4-like [Hipposideros armiger]
MPRGQKSKLRAHEKFHHSKAQTQSLKETQVATAEEEKATSSSSPDCGDSPSISAVAGSLPAPPSVPATISATAGVSCKRSDVNANSQVQKSKNSSEASPSTDISCQDLLTRKASMLVRSLLYKYKVNEPIEKADMLKIVHKRYKKHLPEILRKASEYMDLVFGLELKEVHPNSHSYTLFFNSDDTSIGSLSSAWRFPTKGILMPLLGLIFLNGNHASEKAVWEFLNILGIYDGKRHFIFGEPRKLITQDLVKEKYLEYRQVPNSDPARFEFLWGSRAHAETTKMRVLEFLSKFCDTIPRAFPSHYEEALRDEEERARAVSTTKGGTTSKAIACSKATSRCNSHPE